MSAPFYNLSDDLGSRDESSVSPHWIIYIIRQKYPITYSRVSLGSISEKFDDAVATEKPLIITDSLSVSVTYSKRNHVSNASAFLAPSANYLSDVMPGDYIFIWMVQDDESYNGILSKLKKDIPDPCNGATDGLKFVGRVSDLRKRLTQMTDGTKTVRYQLNAIGFSELDATVYYNPYLEKKVPALGEFFARIGAALNHLVSSMKDKTGIKSEDAIEFFLCLLLGTGVPPNSNIPYPENLKATAGLEASHSYIVPKAVGAVLDKTRTSKDSGMLASADIIETILGIQKYSSPEVANAMQIGPRFAPDNVAGFQRSRTKTPMLGTFLPVEPHFSNKSVWSILSNYINPTINEMYACLRINADNLVVPTIVARQIPFSTGLTSDSDIETTSFWSIPRWKADPISVVAMDVGRSDGLRHNYIQILGDAGAMRDPATNQTNQTVRNPPIRDDLDIARSGLRPYIAQAACHISDIVGTNGGEIRKWTKLVADFLMGEHMTLTGTATLIGVQSPICIGDNFEFDNTVYHIESVTHTCQIDPRGNKIFRTSLALSHGMSNTEPDAAKARSYPIAIYSDTGTASGNNDMNPGLTIDPESSQPIDYSRAPAKPPANTWLKR